MKKLLSAILCIAIIIIYIPTVGAADIFGAPKVKLKGSETAENDITYRFSVDCGDAVGYEKERRAVYEKLHPQYTDDMLIAAGEGWVTYETLLLVQAETDAGTADVNKYPVKEKSLELSLSGDILPALVRAGLYTHEAFSFRLSFQIVLDNGKDVTTASSPVLSKSLHCPATAHIVYKISAKAVNPNPAFLFLPYKSLKLKKPTLTGYTFAGWSTGKAKNYISKVPADTLDLTLTANWTPKTFKINYVLTTRQGYFVYSDNSANPQTRTYGQKTKLYDIKAPYGYLFCGWYKNPSFSGEPVTEIPAKTLGDVILYAKWLTQDEKDMETIRKLHWGDPDDDGKITMEDARLALRFALELETPTKEQIKRLDYFDTRKVTLATARQTLRIALELDDPLEVLRSCGRL